MPFLCRIPTGQTLISMDLLIKVLSGVVIASALIPFLPFKHWFFKGFQVGRLFFFGWGMITTALWLLVMPESHVEHVWLILVVACTIYQGSIIFPYTPLAPKQSSGCGGTPDLSVLWANVLQTNENKEGFIRLVTSCDPDVFVTLESDQEWEQALDTLAPVYPHAVKVPKDNLYGMHLYSKFPFLEQEVLYLVDQQYPSIHVRLDLGESQATHLMCVHPPPPAPMEKPTSILRDGELMVAARYIEKLDGPMIVCGDLNDVAWSRISKLFLKVSRLLDPRRGRGLFNTFHAWYPFLRAPIDHIFHSRHFKVHAIKRLPKFGSDHFAMYCGLCLKPQSQEVPNLDQKDVITVEEKIQAAVEETGE